MPDAPIAFAIAAHPDDIELMMGGTFALLGQAGYALHYMNVANGSCGTASEDYDAIVARRTEESRQAAAVFGAVFHPPLVDDLGIFYTPELVARVAAVIREVRPTILLVQSPADYMEDHTNAVRVAVTAAFVRGMRNFQSDPKRPPVGGEVTVYHALPWGLRDPLRRRITAGLYVDVSSTLAIKREALACHASQKEWLDVSQGHDSYLITMEEMTREVGRLSGRFEYAEGWRRHLHLGFCTADADPLSEALGGNAFVSDAYEAELG